MYFIKKPSGILSIAIDYYWELNTNISGKDIREYLFAYPYCNLVFNLCEYYNKQDSKFGNEVVHADKLIGPRTIPVSYTHWLNNHLFGIKFKPGGLSLFAELPMMELIDETPEIRIINNSLYKDLRLNLSDNFSIHKGIQDIEATLVRYIKQENVEKVKLVSALFNRYMSRNRPSVKDLALWSGLNIKTIERLFIKTIGLLPKDTFTQVRCLSAIKEILSTNDWFSFHNHGFYDQTHFIKYVRKYSHHTPTKLIRLYTLLGCASKEII